MTKDEAQSAIRRAIDAHIKRNRAIVCNPDGLVALILAEMGYAEEFEYNGWRVRRVIGKDIGGTPRGSKTYYGYVAKKPGRADEVAAPAGQDVPLSYFKTILDGIDARKVNEGEG